MRRAKRIHRGPTFNTIHPHATLPHHALQHQFNFTPRPGFRDLKTSRIPSGPGEFPLAREMIPKRMRLAAMSPKLGKVCRSRKRDRMVEVHLSARQRFGNTNILGVQHTSPLSGEVQHNIVSKWGMLQTSNHLLVKP